MAQLLSNLPIGSKVKFGKYSVEGETPQDIAWIVVSKSGNITLLTEKLIDFRAFDAKEPTNPETDIQTGGNNRFVYSNLRQWLNSDAEGGKWYSPQHPYDFPPNNNYIDYLTGYEHRPGFLSAFTDIEKGAILSTSTVTTSYVIGNNTSEVSTQKVFLPSLTEVTGAWEYFSNNQSRICKGSDQAYANTKGNVDKNSAGVSWWLRDAGRASYLVCFVYGDGVAMDGTGANACNGLAGVRPALALLPSVSVSDTSDTDGYYSIILNYAPPAPPTLTVPMIYGGKSNLIAWGAVVDPNGDAVTYHLECSLDGEDYVEIYNGAVSNYAHLVPFGTSAISYRVKASDPLGESSAYTTSATINVVNNNAPVISGSDSNLGVKSEGFTGTYTIEDADSNAVTVTEAIDGVRIRSLVATLGEEITYGVTETTWLALPNGSHTLTISATDGIDTTVRTLVFTKLVDKFSIQNSTPWASSTMPSRIMLVVTRNIPSTSTFKVEVCNNGYDASPTWEDATDAVVSGLVHVMTNTRKTAANWGVLVKVTVERNGATGACYVSAIGGNFE